jgi:mono/diheme cytochrome c family protein
VLLQTGSCATCHNPDGVAGPIDPVRVSRPRNWVASHLVDPEMIAPGLRPSPAADENAQHDREAVLAALARGRSGASLPTVNDEGRTAVLFNRHCLRCHVMGPVGGSEGPTLTGIGGKMDENRIVRQITSPLDVDPNGEMPSFADKLSSDEIAALARWLSRK